MKLYARTPIQHDGEDIAVGEAFDVRDEKTAKALLDAGSASKRKPEADESAGDDTQAGAGAQ